MTKVIWAPALCLALGAAAIVRAAPPVEADPGRDYTVTPDAGPWMICACYFTGPAAPDLAHQLVLQIRSRYNAPAYLFNYADEERKRQQAIIDREHPALPFDASPDGADRVVPIPRHHMVVHVEEQCAVLIGGYADEDAAHKALLAVKKWGAPTMKAPEGVLPFGSVIERGQEHVIDNPFTSMSMVVRNPAVPHDSTAVDPKKDKFLLTLNAAEDYSMLNCPGKFTLAVKEYVGAAMVKPDSSSESSGGGLLKMIGFGNRHEGDSLAMAADNAHELARTLRQLKFDAYVLHTRTSSVVSVGGFNAPNDPEVDRLRRELDALQQRIANAQTDPAKKNLLGLFPTPVPIEVPHP